MVSSTLSPKARAKTRGVRGGGLGRSLTHTHTTMCHCANNSQVTPLKGAKNCLRVSEYTSTILLPHKTSSTANNTHASVDLNIIIKTTLFLASNLRSFLVSKQAFFFSSLSDLKNPDVSWSFNINSQCRVFTLCADFYNQLRGLQKCSSWTEEG